MTTVSLSLPEDLQNFLNQQIAAGGYGTASDYISNLLRQEQERAERKRLEALLLEGLDSGEPLEVDEAWWSDKREALGERLRQSPS